MATSYKNPPALNDEIPYEQWTKEIKLWSIVSKSSKSEQAAAVALSLQGRARKAAMELDLEELNSEGGLALLIQKLDGLFLKDSNQRMYVAFSEFEKYKRSSDTNIDTYISDFDRLYNKVKVHKVEYPDALLAYKLLENCNLPSETMAIVRQCIGQFTFEDMKAQLRKIEDVVVQTKDVPNEGKVPVKEEPLDSLYGRDDQKGNRGRGNSYRGSWRGGRGRRPYRGRSDDSNRSGNTRGGSNGGAARGKPKSCFVCKSERHFARDCPHKDDQENVQEDDTYYEEEEIGITLFTKGMECYQGKLLSETVGCAVLDSGCIKNVCSQYWLDMYLETLSDKDRSSVIYTDSNARFRFGDGSVYESKYRVKFPANIVGYNLYIETDVIDNEIPLLLSKKAMQRARTVIDFEKDEISMFGKIIKLISTTSGHYAIALNGNIRAVHSYNGKESKIKVVLFSGVEKIDNSNTDEKRKMCVKIHKQFGHATGARLKILLKDAGVENKEMLKQIECIDQSCDICNRFKKALPKPIVCIPLAKVFNESVAMDLKTIDSSLILHIIDHATRYSSAVLVSCKRMDVIVEAVLKFWVALFGTPARFLTDNGLEFGNDEFREMGEKLNTTVKSTAAESPWSNGINERHNGVLGEMIIKIKADSGCNLPTAIAWAVSAKNSLANVYGYSPNQLVFGRNPSFPSLLDSKLPALDQSASSKTVMQNLNALHSARAAFIAAESSEKLSRALRAKTRTSTALEFENGQSVYYKRDGEPAWRGPGTVIGKEGKTVIVKHGSVIVRVSPSRLRHENSEFIREDIESPTIVSLKGKDHNKATKKVHFGNEKLPNNAVEEDSDSDENYEETFEDSRGEVNETISSDENTVEVENGLMSGDVLPKKNQSVIAKDKDNNWKRYDIISRAGKATGKYANHLNVFDKNEKKGYSLDWKNDIVEWKEAVSEEVLITESEQPEILEAKFKELEKWIDYGVYEPVKYTGQNLISVRWVCTSKDGQVKARLVARGFEDDCINIRTDSPTCSKMNLRLTVAIASSKGWEINSLDIQSAFLQGEVMERDVYLKPPLEANTDKVWHLKRCVYGLNEAARKWYLKATSEIAKLGMKQSKYDEAIFFWHHEGVLQGIMTSHVDDFFWAGTGKFQKKVIDKIKSTFKISSEQKANFRYLGIQATQSRDDIVLDQDVYINSIEKMKVVKEGYKWRQLNEEEKQNFRKIVGQLLWVSSQTRPDIAYDACELSNTYRNAVGEDIQKINKAISKLKNNRLQLRFCKLEDLEHTKLVVFSDASYRNLPGGGSQGAFVIFLCNTYGNCSRCSRKYNVPWHQPP